MPAYPDRGNLIHLNFSPSAGTEMREPHYALVISPKLFSQSTGKAIVCPITSTIRGTNFEVVLKAGILPKKSGALYGRDSVILTDQVRSIDYKIRHATYIADAPPEVLEEALEKVLAILDPAS